MRSARWLTWGKLHAASTDMFHLSNRHDTENIKRNLISHGVKSLKLTGHKFPYASFRQNVFVSNVMASISGCCDIYLWYYCDLTTCGKNLKDFAHLPDTPQSLKCGDAMLNRILASTYSSNLLIPLYPLWPSNHHHKTSTTRAKAFLFKTKRSPPLRNAHKLGCSFHTLGTMVAD